MPDLTLGDIRRATAQLPDSTPVHASDPENVRPLGQPIVWEGALYLPVLAPSGAVSNRVGMLMRLADEELGLREHVEAMTVGELLEVLEEWPMSAPVTFSNTRGRPEQHMDGDPVSVDGVALPDGLYIGWLTDTQRKALGWERS